MKKALITFIILFCFSAQSHDCEITNPSLESIPEYLLRMAESLTELKFQVQRLSGLEDKKDKSATDAMVALKDLKSGFLCASNLVGSYKKSKNKRISESAEILSKSYRFWVDEMDAAIETAKAKLDGKEDMSPGEEADKESDKIIAIRKNWQKITDGVDLGMSATVEKINPKTNKILKFSISKSERDSIIKELKSQFKLPMKDTKTAIDEVAVFYYEFLMQVKYK